MKPRLFIIIGVTLLFGLILFLVMGRKPAQREGTTEWDLEYQSFSQKDKAPGGCYAAFQGLQHLYNGERPKIMTRPFARSFKKDIYLLGRGNLYMVVTNVLYTSEQDVEAMLKFASIGNQLFIAANQPDSLLLDRLGLSISFWRDTANIMEEIASSGRSSIQHYVNPYLAPDTAFEREDIYRGARFTRMRNDITTILGTDGRYPNFVRVSHGNGDIFLLLNPSSFTNYFLMHQLNIASLEKQLAYTFNNPTGIYWDEYYKYLDGPQRNFSEWDVLLRYPGLRWALWLLVALLLIYVVFEGKRRQRIIPDRPALVNNSLEFADTLGQLYYQQGNNRNLAQKMIMHWTEYVRNRFYLHTVHLNMGFIQTLAHKSGQPQVKVQEIVDSIHHIQLSAQISDDYLAQFYRNIQAFYQNTK